MRPSTPDALRCSSLVTCDLDMKHETPTFVGCCHLIYVVPLDFHCGSLWDVGLETKISPADQIIRSFEKRQECFRRDRICFCTLGAADSVQILAACVIHNDSQLSEASEHRL